MNLFTPPVRIVAEAGLCDNSTDWAIRAVQAAADAGVWGFKVQMLYPDRIASPAAVRYDQGLSRVPDRQRDSFADPIPYRDWVEVKAACDDLGLVFFASCWDHQAVDACMDLGVELFKVGSGDITYDGLLRYIGATGLPVVLSTGASTYQEFLHAHEWLYPADVLPMVCTLSYPCPLEEANLARIRQWQEKGWTVGYSDHTADLETPVWAASLGAVMVEKHFTITPRAGGDHDFALSPSQLRWAVRHSQDPLIPPPSVLGDGAMTVGRLEGRARVGARRSVHAARDVGEGVRLVWEDLVMLRPGGGVPPFAAARLIGCETRRPYRAGDMIEVAELL